MVLVCDRYEGVCVLVVGVLVIELWDFFFWVIGCIFDFGEVEFRGCLLVIY